MYIRSTHFLKQYKNSLLKSVFLVLSLLFFGSANAERVTVENIRFAEQDTRTRVVLDMNQPITLDTHHVMVLKKPFRVVLDVFNANQPRTIAQSVIDRIGVIKNVRIARDENHRVRIVFDMNQAVRPESFILKPGPNNANYRLVMDMYPTGEVIQPPTPLSSAPVVSEQVNTQPSAQTIPVQIKKPKAPTKKLRDVLIAIDAGHGGKDPGAVANGLREKDITLSVARLLAKEVNKQKGMKAMLIRDSDVYIKLRSRMERARKAKADLFISLHADAFTHSRAHGSSVFALSLNGATSEAARRLADRENKADDIGGVDLSDKDQVLASVLLDLSQTASIRESLEVGKDILKHMGGINKLHKPTVQQAGFAVLKSPDIPSVLIETAFLTNPSEAKKLSNPQHQKKIARSIVKGLNAYFKRKAPEGTVLSN